MNKTLLGKFMLLSAALIWGSSFVIMKNAVDFITPEVLLCIRFTLGTLLMTIFFFKDIKKVKIENIKWGFFGGLALFMAFSIQTFGLRLTTPGKNAFLTAVYCTIVPFLSWFVLHKKPEKKQFLAAILCFIGVGCVSLDSSLNINLGDIFTLIGGFLYAVHILISEKSMQEMSPILVTTLQFAFAAIFTFIGALLFEDLTIITTFPPQIYLHLGYLAVFCTLIAYLFQNLGQKYVNENTAALLLSLESVFGVFFSILLKAEQLNFQIGLGFVIIFIAIVISEMKFKKGEQS